MLKSIAIAIAIFHLLIAANFLAPLLSCRLQDALRKSMKARHIIGFCTLYFFVILTQPDLKFPTFSKNLMITFALYILFLMMTKTDFQIFIIIWFAFLAGIFFHNYSNNEGITEEESIKYANIGNNLIKTAIGIIVFGFIVYMGQKKVEYGKQFSFLRFIKGVPDCRFSTPSTAVIKSPLDVFYFTKVALFN